MSETQRQLHNKAQRKYRARMRDEGKAMAAELAATVRVPYDPLGRRRFQELDAALKGSAK